MSNFKKLITALALTSLANFSFAAIAPGSYVIDSAHTSVNFSVDHMGYTKLSGRFNDISGNIEISNKNSSSLSVIITTASIDTNHSKRDEHLRSPDFFNSKQFPEIKFFSPLSSKKNHENGKIMGEIEILGVTKPVELTLVKGNEGKDPWGLYRIGYTASTVIKRSDFGMNFMQGGVGDDITLVIQVEATRK